LKNNGFNHLRLVKLYVALPTWQREGDLEMIGEELDFMEPMERMYNRELQRVRDKESLGFDVVILAWPW